MFEDVVKREIESELNTGKGCIVFEGGNCRRLLYQLERASDAGFVAYFPLQIVNFMKIYKI